MKICRPSFIQVVLFLLLLVGLNTFALAQEQSPGADYTWLNGKWAGTPPAGGELQMDLKVVNGNKIQGDGFIPGGGRRSGGRPSITGTVDGNKVVLETYFPESQRRVVYRCLFKEDVLQCSTGPKFHTTFSRLK